MADKKQDLPFGWVVKQSKSYPDRIYYFNVNTGASTWEFPDLLQHYVNEQGHSGNGQGYLGKAPVLTSTVLKTVDTAADAVSVQKSAQLTTNVPQKRRGPQTASVSSGSHLLTGSTINRTSAVQGANFPPQQVAVNDRYIGKESAQRKLLSTGHRNHFRENLSKPYAKSSPVRKKFSGVSRNLGLSSLRSDPKKTGECSKLVNNARVHLSGANKIVQNQKLSQPEKVGKQDTLLQCVKGISQVPSKTAKPAKQMECSDAILSLIKKKLHREKSRAPDSADCPGAAAVYKSLNAIKKCVKSLGNSLNPDCNGKRSESEIAKRDNGNSVLSISNPATKLKRPRVDNKDDSESREKLQATIALPSGTEKRKNVSSSSHKDSERNVKKIGTERLVTSDKRKVVKSCQSLPADNRSVLLKDKKLKTLQLGKNNKLSPDFDLTVSTSATQISDSAIVIEDEASDIVSEKSKFDNKQNSSTEFKLFIGDKDKLLSIQSWINNLQEDAGSESPSVDLQVNPGLVNSSASRGNVSEGNRKLNPTKRGWPGELKKSDVTCREVVDMEIDECFVSKPSPTEVNEEECMDIDEVLVEVRQQVCSSNDKHIGSFVTSVSDTDTSSPLNKKDQTITVVVDTNVLISDLELLERLKDYTVPGSNLRPCLFIPWIVLRELDLLKDTKKPDRPSLSQATQKKARRGISFLKNLFSVKHPRVRGQTPKQYAEAYKNFKSHCNDDVILQACLQCQKSEQGVVLVTNDNNLINKALVSNVPAFNAKGAPIGSMPPSKLVSGVLLLKRSLVEKKQLGLFDDIKSGLQHAAKACLAAPDCHTPSSVPCDTQASAQCQSQASVVNASPSVQVQTNASAQTFVDMNIKACKVVKQVATPSQSFPSAGKPGDAHTENSKIVDKQDALSSSCKLQQKCQVDGILKEKKSYTVEALVDDMYCKMKSVLHEAFGKILEVEMKKAYDDIWTDILYKKQPWSLKDIFECWKKHWMAVFGMVFSRHLSKNVHMLLEYISSSSGVTVNVVYDMCAESLQILLEAKDRNLYGPRIPEIVQTVIVLTELCCEIKQGSVSATSISSLEQFLKSKVDAQSADASQDDCQTVNQCTVQQTSTAVIKTVQSTSVSQNGSSCVLPLNSMQTLSSPSTQTHPQLHIPYPANRNLHPAVSQHSYEEDRLHGNSVQTVTSAGNQNTVAEQAELVAGERFSHIWNFIYKYCNEFYKTLSGTAATNVTNIEPVLKQLVSSSLELRKYYTGLLELPVVDLKNHEEEFTLLSHICNTFLTKFNNQQEDRPLVTPLQLLILYSKAEYRETLTRFLAHLDEMLHMMYQCLHKLCPDD